MHEVGRDAREDLAEASERVAHALRVREGRADVQRERSTGGHSALREREGRGRIELHRRPDRVGEVHDDEVVAHVCRAQVREPVADRHLEPRIVEDAAVDLGELRPGHLDHVRIELRHVDYLEGAVLEKLLRGSAVAAADHERALRARVRDRRGMDEVLVVEELVALRGHVEAVEAEDSPELRRVVDFEELVGGPAPLDERALEPDAARLVQALEDLLRQLVS